MNLKATHIQTVEYVAYGHRDSDYKYMLYIDPELRNTHGQMSLSIINSLQFIL